jgi:hypothetical protein
VRPTIGWEAMALVMFLRQEILKLISSPIVADSASHKNPAKYPDTEYINDAGVSWPRPPACER